MTIRTNKYLVTWKSWREIVHYTILALYFILPMSLPFSGMEHGIVAFDFDQWRIYFFGVTLVQGLFHLAFLGIILALWGLTVSSRLYSKVFCGWVCPQNIFFEMFASLDKSLKKRYPSYRHSKKMQNTVDLAFALFWGTAIGLGALRYFIGASPVFLVPMFLVLFLWTTYDLHVLKHKFCESACPYAFLQKSLQTENSLHVQWEQRPGNKCGVCTACVKACYVDLDVKKTPFHMDCTMCGACVDACERVYGRRKESSLLSFAFEDKVENHQKQSRWGFNTWDKKVLALSLIIGIVSLVCAFVYRPVASFRLDYGLMEQASAEERLLAEQKGVNSFILKVRNLSADALNCILVSNDDEFFLSLKESISVQAFEKKEQTVSIHYLGDSETFVPMTVELINADTKESLGEQELYFNPFGTTKSQMRQ